MTPEIIIILVLAVLCGVLTGGIILLWYINLDTAEMYSEEEQRVSSLRSDNIALMVRNAELTEKLSEAAVKIDGYAEKIDEMRAEIDRLFLAATAAASDAAEDPPEIISEPAAARSVPAIDWTFDRLPDGLTHTFRCEDFRLFASGTEQWQLQQECITDIDTGIRFYMHSGKPYLCAAMASAYGITIGSGFEAELENGEIINVIMADYKHDLTQAHADDFGDPDTDYSGNPCTCVIEFVYDKKVAPRLVLLRGGMFIERFGGLLGTGANIVRITYEGRIWKP